MVLRDTLLEQYFVATVGKQVRSWSHLVVDEGVSVGAVDVAVERWGHVIEACINQVPPASSARPRSSIPEQCLHI